MLKKIWEEFVISFGVFLFMIVMIFSKKKENDEEEFF